MIFMTRKNEILFLALLFSAPCMTVTASGYDVFGIYGYFMGQAKRDELPDQGTSIPGMAGTYHQQIGFMMRQWKEDTGIVRNERRVEYNCMILHGPRGNGKTTLIRKFAEQTNSKLVEHSGPSIVTKYVGSGFERIHAIFNEAIAYFEQTGQRVVIFIDELDAIMQTNNIVDNISKEYANVEKELWLLLDKYKDDNRVFFVGATNHIERFSGNLQDRYGGGIIEIANPDANQRESVMQHYFRKRHDIELEQVCPDNCKENLIRATQGFSRRDIERLNTDIVRDVTYNDKRVTPELIAKHIKLVQEWRAKRDKTENDKKAREERAEALESAALWHHRVGTIYSALGSINFIKDILISQNPNPTPAPTKTDSEK